MHVLCTIDRNYIHYCSVMLASLFENNKGVKIQIHLIVEESTVDDWLPIKNLVLHYGGEINLYFVGNELLKGYPEYTQHHITSSAYYRIFAPSLLPVSVSKVLYLDCDLIIRGNIFSLWEEDIQSYAVGCIEDMWSAKLDNYSRLGYDQKYSYFNSGVLLINLDYWRTYYIQDKIVNYILINQNRLIFIDQDALNAVLHDQKKWLPFKWNMQDGFFRIKRKIRKEAWPELDEAIKDPIIVHYTGGKKPWDYKSVHPYKLDFYKYQKLTDWKDFYPKVDWSFWLINHINKMLISLGMKEAKYYKIKRYE